MLTEQSFLNPNHQHFLSNKRWYKYNEDDGRRVWKPTEDYEKDERRVKMFAKKNFGLRSRKNTDFLDFNLVGPFSQAPTDFGMRDKNGLN